MNTYDLQGRVALVTGGASGIGAAAVEALGAAGAEVAIFDRSIDGSDGLAIAGDISRSGDVDRAVAEVTDALGRVDILVNSAGIPGPWKSALELTDDEWDSVQRINSTGAFYACRAAAPGMVERAYGRIILITSIAGKEGNPLIPAYAASKAAVIALAKSLGRDLAKTGVLVHCVAPAVIATPMAVVESADQVAQMVSHVPLGRMGRPEEVAALICWLASEDCSFSTGAVYDLTGGRSVY